MSTMRNHPLRPTGEIAILVLTSYGYFNLTEFETAVTEIRYTNMAGLHNTTRGHAAPDLANTIVFMANRALAVLWDWQFRARSRRQLARMDAHQLRDIGIDSRVRDIEAAKPFWRG